VSTPLPVLPQIIVEAGLTPDAPAGQSGTALRLSDAVFGLLDTGTLGTATGWTDISAQVISFTITRPSTRLQGPLWNYQAGTVTILLDNSTGQFDPDNLAGPYVTGGATQLIPMVPVRVRANFASVAYGLYSGFADGWLPAQVTYEGGYAELTVAGTDAFKILAGVTLAAVSIEGAGADTGARMRDILGRVGWYTSSERLLIDTGNSLLQGTTLGADALSLMQVAADSEIGRLYVNGSGAIVFRNRRSLLTDPRSSTVQAVFGDLPGTVQPAGTELTYAAVGRANDDTTIANDVQATRLSGGLQEVKDLPSIAKYLFPRTYARGDLILQSDGDALNWAQWVLYVSKGAEDRFETLQVDPAADPYTLWPQVLGREIGDRIQVWVRPPGVAAGALWSLANNFGSAPTVNFTIATTSVALLTSGDRFQVRTSGGVLKEATVFTITSIGADFFGNTAVTFTPAAQAVLAVGDLVTQTAGEVAKDCFIAGITHVWDSAASSWLTTWTLQSADKYGSFFTLDNATLGRLNSNALTFLADPQLAFQLRDPGVPLGHLGLQALRVARVDDPAQPG